MINFKTYRKSLQKPRNVLSWTSSFAEHRGDLIENWETTLTPNDIPHKRGSQIQAIHYDQDVVPKGLTNAHISAIRGYTSTSAASSSGFKASRVMNDYLRNRMGDRSRTIRDHPEAKVKKSIKDLSAVFTPENTNRKTIETYSGIPSDIGKRLEASDKDSKHTLAGFSSFSTARKVAHHFGVKFKLTSSKRPDADDSDRSIHLIHATLEPGSGLSLVDHSNYENENEILLNHGAHITYHGTTVHKDSTGRPVRVHHVTVHSTHEPLENYSEYRA